MNRASHASRPWLTNEVVFSSRFRKNCLQIQLHRTAKNAIFPGKNAMFEKRVVPSCYCVKHKMVTNQSPFLAPKSSRNGIRNWSKIKCVDQSTSEWTWERFLAPIEPHLGSIWLHLWLMWASFGPTCAPTGPIGPRLGPLWPPLVPIWAACGPHWALFGPRWPPSGPHLCPIGLIWGQIKPNSSPNHPFSSCHGMSSFIM